MTLLWKCMLRERNSQFKFISWSLVSQFFDAFLFTRSKACETFHAIVDYSRFPDYYWKILKLSSLSWVSRMKTSRLSCILNNIVYLKTVMPISFDYSGNTIQLKTECRVLFFCRSSGAFYVLQKTPTIQNSNRSTTGHIGLYCWSIQTKRR